MKRIAALQPALQIVVVQLSCRCRGGFPCVRQNASQTTQREQTPIMEVEVNAAMQVIKKLRDDRAWSKEHLATVAGLNVRTDQRLEAGGNASRKTRMAVAAAFGIEQSQLNSVSENPSESFPTPAVTTSARLSSP